MAKKSNDDPTAGEQDTAGYVDDSAYAAEGASETARVAAVLASGMLANTRSSTATAGVAQRAVQLAKEILAEAAKA